MSWATNLDECHDPADYAYCACVVYSCGYSQLNRENISIALLKAGMAEADCSSLVCWVLFIAGYIQECIWFATRDGTELGYLESQGFTYHDPATTEPQRNDVLWRYGHTALYIGEGMQAEALRTENYDDGWNGSEAGDQDGGETVVREYPAGGWTWILRPPAQEPEPEEVEEEPAITEEDMKDWVLVRPDGQNYMVLVCGDRVHPIAHPDEENAVKMWYKELFGEEIRVMTFGNSRDPWAKRLFDVFAREAK